MSARGVAFSLNGLTVGAGGRWSGTISDGLGDAGGTATAEPRVQADGQWSTTAYRQPLAVGVQGLCKLDSILEMQAARRQLIAALPLTAFPLTVHWPSGDATLQARRDGGVVWQPVTDTLIQWSATIVADDPVWYAGDGSGSADWTQPTGLPQSSGGVTWPATWPLEWTGTSATGDLAVITTGGGVWWWRIDGPVVNPRVIVTQPDGTVRRIEWAALSLAAGEWLEVDPQLQRAMLQGQASRTPSIRQWPTLQPGTTTVQFRAASFDSAARLTVRVRPAL